MITDTERTNIIEHCITWMQDNIPARTTEYDKCRRDMGMIIDSWVEDITNDTEVATNHIGSCFHHRGDLVISSPQLEHQVHNVMASKLREIFPNDSLKINRLNELLGAIIDNNPTTKKGNPRNLDLANQILTLSENRHNWKPLTGDAPSAEDKEMILKAAGGMTPALSNEYNYRVDEVPDSLKSRLVEQTANRSEAADESGNEGYARDINPQLEAPLVLVYSLRYNQDNDNIEQFCGDMTVRDPNVLNIGVCVWHTVLVAEALGYKTSFCQMTNWKRDKCKEILGLETDEQPSEHLIRRNGNTTFMPMFFLCIGTEGGVNSNTRVHKQEDIVNKLRFNYIGR